PPRPLHSFPTRRSSDLSRRSSSPGAGTSPRERADDTRLSATFEDLQVAWTAWHNPPTPQPVGACGTEGGSMQAVHYARAGSLDEDRKSTRLNSSHVKIS